MKYVPILVALFITFASRGYARPFDEGWRYQAEITGGFGKQYAPSSPVKMPDGTPVDFTSYFLKSFRVGGRVALGSKYAAGINIGLTYDYGLGYTVRKNKANFSIGEDAGSEIYTAWHAIVNLYRQLAAYRGFSLTGYVGAGAQVYPYGNYYKTATPQNIVPNNSYTYLHQPSEYTSRPLPVANAGLEIYYSIGRHNAVFLQPSVRLGTKAFITDIVRIDGPSGAVTIRTPITGTHAVLSFGYAYRF